MKLGAKILIKTLRNQTQKYIIKIIHHSQVDFILGMQGSFNTLKFVNVMQHIKSLRERDHRIIPGIYSNIVKAVFSKSIANSILKEEKLQVFPLKPRMRQEYQFPPLVFNIVLKTTVSLFAHDIINPLLQRC